MKKILAVAAALVAAALAFAAVSLPPRRLTLEPIADGTVPGVLHIHTNRSDGLSGADEIAAAAARAGIKFLVFTDHGDATRTPDAPTYRSSVLCIDAVEISTTGGHYIAIDMPAAPYPLGGEPRDVVEDVARLGGFGIAAHPDSPKPQLRWDDWTVPFDGVELLNLDTSWRMLADRQDWAARRRLFVGLFDYPFRPVESIAQLIQPTTTLPQWDAVSRRRRLVSVGGADAHAKIGSRNGDPADARFALPLPSYEASFKVQSVRVRPDEALSGDAKRDAGLIIGAIRQGHLYTAVDGIAAPPALEFTGSNASGSASQGDVLKPGGGVTLHVRSNAPPDFVTLVHDGLRTISTVRDSGDITVHAGDAPAVYWTEIVTPGAEPITWLRSNPIYVRPLPAPAATAPPPAAIRTMSLFDGKTTSGWTIEHDALSLGAVDIAGAADRPTLRYRFGLAIGADVGQYASLVVTLADGAAGFDAIRFRIRAEKPMRVSVQTRTISAARWQRSVYASAAAEERTVRFDDFRPVGAAETASIPTQDLRSVMFVVDTANTDPGASGRIWIEGVALVKLGP